MSEATIKAHVVRCRETLEALKALVAARMRVLSRSLANEAKMMQEVDYEGASISVYLLTFAELNTHLTLLQEKGRELQLLRLAVDAEANGAPLEAVKS